MAGSGKAHLRDENDTIIRVEDLVVEFPAPGGQKVHAVSGISLDVALGETLGIVGESGCGKSTTAKAMIQLPRPTGGSVRFKGQDLTAMTDDEVRELRTDLQIIFQDPISSLNPRRRVGEVIAEPLRVWDERLIARRQRRPLDWVLFALGVLAVVLRIIGVLPLPFLLVLLGAAALISVSHPATQAWLRERLPGPGRKQAQQDAADLDADIRNKVDTMLEAVGIDPVVARPKRPHEFSGGQCQRLSIARALVLEPQVIICDEPVSALDVSVQAQTLNLLEDLKAEFGLTLVFIAHDLAVVKNISDRVAVMYLGKLCEVAEANSLYNAPAHPYTNLLLNSSPVPDPLAEIDETSVEEAELPSPINPPSGCRFRTRCDRATDLCVEVEPELTRVRDDHYVACHFPMIEPEGDRSRDRVASVAASAPGEEMSPQEGDDE